MKRNLILQRNKFGFQYTAYLRSFGAKHHGTKFAIFGQGRTGSTLLVDLLNRHPKIACEEEIFNRRRHPFNGKIWKPYWFLKGVEANYRDKVFGFKVKIYQLTKHQQIQPAEFLKIEISWNFPLEHKWIKIM